jgi:hypothetical protein
LSLGSDEGGTPAPRRFPRRTNHTMTRIGTPTISRAPIIVPIAWPLWKAASRSFFRASIAALAAGGDARSIGGAGVGWAVVMEMVTGGGGDSPLGAGAGWAGVVELAGGEMGSPPSDAGAGWVAAAAVATPAVADGVRK